MSKVPFKRFITAYLFFGNEIPYITENLKKFGYNISDEMVSEIFGDIRNTLPNKYREMIEQGRVFNVTDSGHIQWLKQFDIFEFYDYTIRRDEKIEDPPEYFKWCKDCMWVHGHKDVMTLINILLFNDEPLDEISKIVMFKYRKKIGVDALELYQKMFWETEGMTAKEAYFFCMPLRRSALVVRQLRSGGSEITVNSQAADTEHDGSDVPVTFHDTKYIKWKIGYRDVQVPTPRDFMEAVKKDSYYKYYESMNMTQSVEYEEEEGQDDRLGEFQHRRSRYRNVEEQRAKMAKHWVDLYLKAEKSIPESGESGEEFFQHMRQMQFEFEDDEKMARIEDMPEVLEDIKGDMSDTGLVQE